MSGMTPSRTDCGYKNGVLPSCAPLAVTHVPRQREAIPQYEPDKALARGTLFPGLDLPLGNIANGPTAECPLTELMAIDFAAHDLSLYLDTHPEDKEAFAAYKDLLKLAKEGHEKYTRQHGPLKNSDQVTMDHYVWLKNPWPWDCNCQREGR